MTISVQAQQLNRYALRAFKPYFATLVPPDLAFLHGEYCAEFVGPRWLRRLASPALALTGLSGWCGKWFDGLGNARNLVQRQGQTHEVMKMVLAERPSLIDGRPAVTVIYPAGSPFPWPYIVDELRVLDHFTLLGMMIITPPGLRRLPFPFLLHASRTAADFGP